MSPEIYIKFTGRKVKPYIKTKRKYHKLEGTIELLDKKGKVVETINIPNHRSFTLFHAAYNRGEYPDLDWRWVKD